MSSPLFVDYTINSINSTNTFPTIGTMIPSLFGVRHSNRNFTREDGWSKNNFNSTFPTALACYMHSKGIHPIYLRLESSGNLIHSHIPVATLFGADPVGDEIFYSFESEFTPYQQLVTEKLPIIDLVTLRRENAIPLHGLEIKLTALPDNSTHHLNDEHYGCEIVVRPDTVVYLALSIALSFRDNRDALKTLLRIGDFRIQNWEDSEELLPRLPEMVGMLNYLLEQNIDLQQPLVMQPIWKTQGKRPLLHDDAFDIFVWSNFAFTRLFFYVITDRLHRISRQARAIIWLMKMLLDFAEDGRINHARVIDELSHATKNDKAFSVPGRITHTLMRSEVLTHPRIKRNELKNIILGGGQNLLSPERRLDAVILGSPELFT